MQIPDKAWGEAGRVVAIEAQPAANAETFAGMPPISCTNDCGTTSHHTNEESTIVVNSLGPPPADTPAGVVIGTDSTTGEPVLLGDSARDQGTYVIGRNGTGKSTLLEHLIVADMERGLGVCLLDPHRDLVDRVLARVPTHRRAEVVLLDVLQPDCVFGLNLFACDDPSNSMAVTTTVERVLHVFEQAWGAPGLGARNAQYLRNCARVIIANGLTMAEIPRLLTNREYRQQLLKQLPAASPSWDFWDEYEQLTPREQALRRESTLDKVDPWLESDYVRHIVGQRERRLNFRALLDERAIVLVKLDADNDSLTSLIGSVIVMELMKAGLSRADMPESERWQRRCMLYADEFDYFASRDFQTILKGTRKYGICTTIAHQERSGLSDVLQGATLQVGNLICFGLISPDAEVLAGEFTARPEQRFTYRRQERLAVSHTPLQHLANSTHSHVNVRQFSQEYASLFLDARTLSGKYVTHMKRQHPIDLSRGLSAGSASWSPIIIAFDYETCAMCGLNAYKRLNQYFIDIMERRIAIGSRQDIDAQLDIIVASQALLAFWLDCHNNYTWGRFHAMKEENVAEVRRFLESSAADTSAVRTSLLQQRVAALCSFVYRQYSQFRYTPPPRDVMTAAVADDAEQDTDNFVRFVHLLRAAAQILATDTGAIKVGTGQYQDIADTPRPIADVRNEIVAELTVQSRGQARVAIYDPSGQRVEHSITTPPRSTSDVLPADAVRQLQQQAQQHICRVLGMRRTDIDLELQERRQAPQAPPPAPEVPPPPRPRRHLEPLD